MKFTTHRPSPFHTPLYAGHRQKPLLYTLKNNTSGLGISPHAAQVDTWWERAFDKQLSDITVNADGKGVSVKGKKNEMVLRATGRWISFVRAGLLGAGNEMKGEGEEGWETDTTMGGTGTGTGANTPMEVEETKEERKARRRKEKEEKEKKKAEKAKRREEKEARRLRRAEKRKRKEKREEKRKKRKTRSA